SKRGARRTIYSQPTKHRLGVCVMIRLLTIRELFHYDDWANQKLLAMADNLSDAQLDHLFEMGEGSLRATLNHLWAAERVWLDRWLRSEKQRFRKESAGVSVTQLADEFADTAAERNALLAKATDADLATPLTYTNMKGETNTFGL